MNLDGNQTQSFLDVDGIDVFYGNIQALRGVSLHVDSGEMVALLGPNGAGKTTTLKAISGLLPTAQGEIRVERRSISGVRPHKLVGTVAHLPEGRELFSGLDVTENLRLGYWSKRRDKAAYSERLEWIFALFPRLGERAGQRAGTLSGGEQQMLAVGRALMSKPKLLLVDELSLGLAPMIVAQIFEALAEVNRQGTSIVLVEQFVHTALEHTARAYVLAKGEVVLEGPSSELLAKPELMSAYLGEAEMPTDLENEAPPKKASPRKRKRRTAKGRSK